MGLRSFLARLLGRLAPVSTLSKNVSTTSAAHLAATVAHVDAAAIQTRTAEAVAVAEATFDADPTDANGDAVIAARGTRDLAQLRRDRASGRVEIACAEQGAAELALAISNARAELEDLTGDADRTAGDLAAARRDLAQAPPAAALALVLEHAARREEVARAEFAAATSASAAILDQIARAEERLVLLDPALADELAPVRAEREEEGRVELQRAASVATFRARIAPELDAIVMADRITAEATAKIAAAFDAQRLAAKTARAEGIDALDLEDSHREVHLFAARVRAQPEGTRNMGKLLEVLKEHFGARPTLDYRPAVKGWSVDTEEQIEWILGAPRGGPAAREISVEMHRRNLAAGDAGALGYEAQKANQRAEGEELNRIGRYGAPGERRIINRDN